ncbi:hypothetical protein J6590_051463 [Homalodisca vitripennis]|nr:hypothetical protein J6590_051463 [Homalodisca vitripennis]
MLEARLVSQHIPKYNSTRHCAKTVRKNSPPLTLSLSISLTLYLSLWQGLTVYSTTASVGEVKVKKPSLTINLETNVLKMTSEPPPTTGQADRLHGKDISAGTHPSSSHARRCLIFLSRDNRRNHYTAPLVQFCGFWFTFLLVQRLESDAVTDLTPGILGHVRLKRSKKLGEEEAQNELSASFRHQSRLDYKI